MLFMTIFGLIFLGILTKVKIALNNLKIYRVS